LSHTPESLIGFFAQLRRIDLFVLEAAAAAPRSYKEKSTLTMSLIILYEQKLGRHHTA